MSSPARTDRHAEEYEGYRWGGPGQYNVAGGRDDGRMAHCEKMVEAMLSGLLVRRLRMGTGTGNVLPVRPAVVHGERGGGGGAHYKRGR